MFVARLLIEKLGFKQVGHLAGSSTIIITMDAQVFFSLFYATPGYDQLLPGFLNIVPSVLHTDLQQLGVVGQLVLRLLVGYFLALDGV